MTRKKAPAPHRRIFHQQDPTKPAPMRTEVVRDERYMSLKALLESKRAEFTDQLRSLREDVREDLSGVSEPEEISAAEDRRGNAARQVGMVSEQLSQVNEALKALDAGTYGTCIGCHEPIPEIRLQALPFAQQCRDCQAANEAEQPAGPRRFAFVPETLHDPMAKV